MENVVTRSVRQGPPSYQEDYYFLSRVEQPGIYGWLLAVMDGHEGTETAELCAQEIGTLFKIANADQAEETLRRLVNELNFRTVHMHAGSTFALALVLESHKKVSLAILGDSPVVVLDKSGQLHVSPEHNARSNMEERMAVEKRGGVYSDGYISTQDGNHGLQLTRSLGDASLGEILSREPDIYSVPDPQWVLVASDGLFDPAHEHTSELLEEIRQFAIKRFEAEDIMGWAERRGLQDNATALVWCLPNNND